MNKQTFLWGSIPSEWTIQNLNELTTYISRGKQPKYVDYSEIRALNQKAIRWGFIDNSVLKYHNPEVKVDEKHFIKKGDVVINSTGTGTVGRTYYFGYSPEQIFADSHVTLVRTNSEVLNPQFLMYQLSTKAYQHFIEGSFLAGSTGQVEFNKSKVQQLPILLPTISEQNSIVNILSSLDEKIELNNQMNETLEEMAQALFKRWFVDFEFPNEEGQPYKSSGGEMVESELGMIPDKWKIITLKDVASLTMGVSPSSDSYNNSEEGLPLINGAADFKGKNISPGKYTSSPKKICELGDMIFGVRATIGNTVFADKQYAIGRGVAALRPIKNVDKEVIFYQLEYAMEKLVNSASGSVFSNLKKGDIESVKFAYYQPIVQQFHNIVNPIVEKIIFNDKETLNLTLIRDALLPKLMSGEIRVSDFES